MTKKKLYVETYGCQMNVVDSEVVVAILQQQDYEVTDRMDKADLILVNTCSIRENAEQKVNQRIREFGRQKKKNVNLVVGVIGCMAELLKDRLLEEERSVDLVIGPDAYRQLPELLQEVDNGQKGINTILSLEETYADVSPVRLDKNHVSSFVSIMRGCNNFCAYCVVPFTRGRERSRDPETIEREVRELYEKGYREVTLLGQNVNSYHWEEAAPGAVKHSGNQSFGNEKDNKKNPAVLHFEDLLERIASIAPDLRIRFATSHPKDLSDRLLQTMAKHPNLCRSIHLPVQSGSTAVLKRMKRGYTRKMYEERVRSIRKYLPEATISTDIITGFCGETEEEHRETLDLMKWAGFDFAYMFKYSERPGTYAAKKYVDDVPDTVKRRRLNEIIQLQGEMSLESKKQDAGKEFEVLAEGPSKKSPDDLVGRTSQNKVVVFGANGLKPGHYVHVRVTGCTSATLFGEVIG
ncbi:MAG: tRNA (N6-isopentenyl adenosine(37)-C2)-methylthiotransferase MiaB [Bacteroidales bacterium]|nr:tRNA (N6-isopentenyl adenosine(37)-C2)-methylthiotransferase MiaB [Bacteroidales bacterium]